MAKSLNVSTDALFGLNSENYDMQLAMKVLQEADNLRDSGSPEEGAKKSADFLNEKCEENIFNYRILMRYVQSVAHLSRFVTYNGVFANNKEEWGK